MSYQNVNSEVHNYQTSDIPMALRSNSSPQCIAAKNRIVNLASQSSSQTSGGSVLFQLAPSNYAISRKSLSWRTRISLTGGDISQNMFFQGPLFGNDAMSIINRVTVYAGSSNSVLQQKNFVSHTHRLRVLHNANRSYMFSDAQLLMANNVRPSRVGGTYYWDVMISLPILDSEEQDFLLYLLNAPLMIQIDLNSVSNTFYSPTTPITEFTCSNNQLIFEAVEVGSDFIAAEKMAVKSNPYVYPVQNELAFALSDSILNGYNLGLSVSSLRAVFAGFTNSSALSQSVRLAYTRQTSDGSGGFYSDDGKTFTPNSQNGAGVNFGVFLDGRLITAAINDTPAMHFYHLKQALRNQQQDQNAQSLVSFDVYTTATNTAPATNASVDRTSLDSYVSTLYWNGADATNFNDEGTIMGGSSCSQISFLAQGYNSFGNQVIVAAVYDSLIVITGDGLEVKR
jgi:hypothetical protein